MTLPAQDIVERREWLIRKDGYFYRPNCQGYTTRKIEAGRYTKAKAETEAAVEPWHMSAVHQDEVPDEPAVADLNATISRLTADNEAERAAMDVTQRRAISAEARVTALAQEVERLRELVQKAFKDGVLYGTNVDVSDVWQAWLSSKVRAELAAASRPLPLQETEK